MVENIGDHDMQLDQLINYYYVYMCYLSICFLLELDGKTQVGSDEKKTGEKLKKNRRKT